MKRLISAKLFVPAGLLLTGLTLAGSAAAQEVYRTVDAEGRVTFTDVPPDDNANTERIELVVTAPATPEPSEADGEEAAEEPSRPLGAEVLRPSTPDEIAAQREENCAYAQQVADTYEVARRLYRPTGDDGREYLTDEEIDQARAEARDNVAIWCD